MQSLLILGRQPALGIAELESLYGSDKVQVVSEKVVIVDEDPCLLAFDRLGGSVKFCKILTTVNTDRWHEVADFVIKAAPRQSADMPEGKMLLGLSEIGFNVSLKQLEASGLSIKKAVRSTGRSVRLVPNKTGELNAAQIIHNKLTSENGWDLVMIKDGPKTIIAQTVKVQDIESYTKRDHDRPMRDSRVGMLPPKLAQIIINLAAGKLPEGKLKSICDTPLDQEHPRPSLGQSVLDPFCGTGVLLQEALLMGYDVCGSDVEERMIEYSSKNLDWLNNIYNLGLEKYKLEIGDATSLQWTNDADIVACETYLGRPFSSLPDANTLKQNIATCNVIISKFLKNIAPQIKSGTRLCVAVPAWQTRPNQFSELPLIDSLSDMGYNSLRFEHVKDSDLIYYRKDQIVARRLLIISKQ